MRYVYIALVVLFTALVLVFNIQNLQVVTVAFLTLSVTLPVSLIVILAYLLGMATGGSAWALIRWAWQGSKPPTAAQH